MDVQSKKEKEIPILLVDDDEDDISLTRRAFEKGKMLNRLYVTQDGEEALEFLEHRGQYENTQVAPRPGIILLDLNMPGINGHQVLKKIKANEDLRRIPVIVLTTSDRQADVRGCYAEGANTFITKPVEFSQFLDAVCTLGKYWLRIAALQ